VTTKEQDVTLWMLGKKTSLHALSGNTPKVPEDLQVAHNVVTL